MDFPLSLRKRLLTLPDQLMNETILINEVEDPLKVNLYAKRLQDKADDYWAYFWPSVCGLVWTLKHLPHVSTCSVIEIGAGGSGVVAVMAARVGAQKVLTTDYVKMATKLLAINVAENNIRSSIVQSVVLDWNDESTWPPAKSFDLVLASDILYDDKHVPAVSKLFLHLLSERGMILIADAGRYPVGPLIATLKLARGIHVDEHKCHYTLNQQQNDLQLIVVCYENKVDGVVLDSVRYAAQKLSHASAFRIEKVALQPATKESDAEEDIYTRKPELLATERPIRKLLAFDWARGSVSPFRPSPQETLQKVFTRLHASQSPECILDLGCGDGEVLVSALKIFPPTTRAVGVDLDEALLLQAVARLQAENLTSRADLHCGDFLSTDPLKAIHISSSNAEKQTMDHLLSSCDAIFVYLLPEAIRKLNPMLIAQISRGAIVISMQWQASALEEHLQAHEPADGYFLYSKKKIL